MSVKDDDVPFDGNLAYLSAFTKVLVLCARRRSLRRNLELQRAGYAPGAAEASKRKRAERQAEAQLKTALQHAERKVRRKERSFGRRVAATLKAGQAELPLERLAQEHDLSAFEKRVLMLALCPCLDNNFRTLLYEAGGDGYTSVRMALDVLCDTIEEKIRARRTFVHSGKLLGRGLLNLGYADIGTESGFLGMELELPRRISSFLLGEHDVDDEITSFSNVIDPEVDFDRIVLPPGKLAEVKDLLANREAYLEGRKAWGIDRILPYGRGTVLLFAGPSGAGKTMLAHALARESGHRLMLVDIRAILNHSYRGFEENLRRVFHEARLQRAILFFDEADEMFRDRDSNCAMPTLLREFEKHDGVAILATNRGARLDEALERRILYKLEFEVPAPDLREQIWEKHLPGEAPRAPDVDLRAMAQDFEFTGGFIKNAVLVAVHRALQRKEDDRRITQEDLRVGAMLQQRNRLGTLADRIVPRVKLSDVVLGEPAASDVRALVAAARRRATVYGAWGFERKLSTGRAFSALFSGPSGTGKTMTAEAVAGELDRCLFPVNLSAVLSKWLGEAEKNIARIFAAARDGQAVLFFDEAEALFAERSGTAYWHHQQVDALLMEMDRYDGIVLLASNLPDCFDAAFERRLCWRVRFPEPDAAAREAIWRKCMPKEAPLAPDVDFAALAKRFAFTGGAIKNVVLRAAFAAASESGGDGTITQALLVASAERESPLAAARRMGFEK